MNIDINGVSIELTKEQIDIVAKHLANQKAPICLPEDTICWAWDSILEKASLRVADGTGKFYANGHNAGGTIHYKCYEPLEMGLILPDEVITSEDITLDMHKTLAFCWDNQKCAAKEFRVIDANNGCTFTLDGSKDGRNFRNYQICTTPYPNLPQWARDMIDVCKD